MTRSELEAYRPPWVSEFTGKSSIIVLAVLILGQTALLARGFLNGEVAQMSRVFQDIGRSLPSLTKLVLRPGVIPGILAALTIGCLGVTMVGLRNCRAPSRRDLGTSALLLALLALALFSTTMVTLAIWLPLIDLCRCLD